MKARRPIVMLGLLLMTSWTTAVSAGSNDTSASSGIIHFTGAIVESPCSLQQRGNQMVSSCYRNGQTVTTAQAISSTKNLTLPLNIGTTEMRWLDNERRLGILTAIYR
ncbi:fimbrial protein [Enterobacterales bacterium CwR94]|nr:fimbrial protein [Enterobacterales bacterium CwR94]